MPVVSGHRSVEPREGDMKEMLFDTHNRAVGVTPYVLLDSDDYRVLGPNDFGSPGLQAIESIGPFVDIQASGPLITVHDSTIEAHKGIGHHPHRFNERLFYILTGELDHDDALNGIRGHMGPGDVGLFTEGRRGMVHSEWNNGDTDAHAYILVYSTNPIPEQTSFTVLSDADAPRYEEAEGVWTKELVGARSPLEVHGDVRLFTDSTLEDGATLKVVLSDGEGGLLSVREGSVQLDAHEIKEGATILLPPAERARSLTVQSVGLARILRVVYGPGHGFVLQDSKRPRRTR
jgi:redox-sensitive bicupin YhaK (pirin superfamily)